MGIRFDKDSRRATNGPMIFFSDPSAEISLGEEIRGAIVSRLSFYAYRRPGDMMISFGSSETAITGIGTPGFVIAPFLPDLQPVTIPYKPSALHNQNSSQPSALLQSFPDRSTTREQHEREVNAVKSELDKEGYGKVVAARAIVYQTTVDPAVTFSNLCRLYPNAFVFCFSTPFTGCWVGASPELLLEAHHRRLSTMSLAGTRPLDSGEGWDEKNAEEQQMVTEFISEAFRKNSLSPSLGATFTRQAGIVEHICTPISANIGEAGLSLEQLAALLKDLSPTPALCGLPRDSALHIIKEYENFSRGCYGGFCGPFHSTQDFSFYVNLRSALIESEKIALFVGGGITRLSDPAKEWEETSLKAKTILNSI